MALRTLFKNIDIMVKAAKRHADMLLRRQNNLNREFNSKSTHNVPQTLEDQYDS